MKDRQAGVTADDQLFDDGLDRIVQVDAVDFAARHQDVVDGNFFQCLDAAGQLRLVRASVIGEFVEQVAAVLFVVLLGDGAAFCCERLQYQPGGSLERPGQGVDQFAQRLEQAVAEADKGVWVAACEQPWQQLGKGQQYTGGADTGQPGPVRL
ncbi:hypothetical protein D3C80_1002420 [compost metagenome]